MIVRMWRGWTTNANANSYERLLRERIFPVIAAKGIEGYRGIQLLRREREDRVEFVTIMWFDSVESLTQFAGDNWEEAYVPAEARALLERFDDRSAHFSLIDRRTY